VSRLGTHVANFSIVGIQKSAEQALPSIELKITKVKRVLLTRHEIFNSINAIDYTFAEFKCCLAVLPLNWAAADSFGLAPTGDDPDVKC
jgi:hypothetical protein